MPPSSRNTPRPDPQQGEHPLECRQLLKFRAMDDERATMDETLKRLQSEVQALQEYRTQMGTTPVDVVAFQGRLDQHLKITAEYITELARSAEVLGATTTILGQHETVLAELQTFKQEADKQAMWFKGIVAAVGVIGTVIVSLTMHSYSVSAKLAAMEADNNMRQAIEAHTEKYHEDDRPHKPPK